MRVVHVVGARPNFMKLAPLFLEMRRFPEIEQRVVHTGQHYDANMSGAFFEDLGLPAPDVDLGVGSGKHGEQTARLLSALEPVLLEWSPDWVCVVGDVNSTLAAALVCAKAGIPVAHVEAGLRSFDRTMPEEVNRILTDQVSDLLFTTEEDAGGNLAREGIDPAKVHFVGNVMIDSLVRSLPRAERSTILESADLKAGDYVLVTLHRPSNVDRIDTLTEILAALEHVARSRPVVFPVHPRTRDRIERAGIPTVGLHLTEPLGYLDFLKLTTHAALVLTDSGGLQEETTFLGVPCVTLRPNTERPVTVTLGTNRLVESRRESIVTAAEDALRSRSAVRQVPPPLWDGHAAERIVAVFRELGRAQRGG